MINVSKKEINKFKVTLLFLPVIPCLILYYKQHITAAAVIVAVCWSMLFIMFSAALLGKNIDKYVYFAIKKILAFLGVILSSLALIFVWIFAIFPTGIFAKILKRDRLLLNKKSTGSYWKDVVEKESNYENQY